MAINCCKASILFFAPFAHQGVRNAQLVENTRHHEINQITDLLRVVVKAGRGRQNHGAVLRELEQVFQMQGGKRRFARHNNQRAALFQRHIGGALD